MITCTEEEPDQSTGFTGTIHANITLASYLRLKELAERAGWKEDVYLELLLAKEAMED